MNNSKREILLFSASWCGPCKKLKEEIKDYPNTKIIDVMNYPATADKYKVKGLPTMIFLENEKIIGRHTGLFTEDNILEWAEGKTDDLLIKR